MLFTILIWLSFSIIFDMNKQESWFDHISTDFETELITNESGDEILINYITSPSQLAGVFTKQTNNGVYATSHEDIFEKISNKYVLKNDIDCSGYTWTGVDLQSGVIAS